MVLILAHHEVKVLVKDQAYIQIVWIESTFVHHYDHSNQHDDVVRRCLVVVHDVILVVQSFLVHCNQFRLLVTSYYHVVSYSIHHPCLVDYVVDGHEDHAVQMDLVVQDHALRVVLSSVVL